MIARPTAAAGAQRNAARCFFAAGVFELGIHHTAGELPVFGGDVAVVHIHVINNIDIHPKRLRAAVGQAVHVAVVAVLIACACTRVGVVGVPHAVNLPVVVVELLSVERHILGRDFACAFAGAADVGKLHIGVVVQQIGNRAVAVRTGGDLATGDALRTHFLREEGMARMVMFCNFCAAWALADSLWLAVSLLAAFSGCVSSA